MHSEDDNLLILPTPKADEINIKLRKVLGNQGPNGMSAQEWFNEKTIIDMQHIIDQALELIGIEPDVHRRRSDDAKLLHDAIIRLNGYSKQLVEPNSDIY